MYRHKLCATCGETKDITARGQCSACYQKEKKERKRAEETDRYVVSGEYYGKKGILEENGRGQVRCHICGRYYYHLGEHVTQWHHVDVDWYREQFDIDRTFGLASDGLKENLAGKIAERWDMKTGKEKDTAMQLLHEAYRPLAKGEIKWRKMAVSKLEGKPPHWFRNNPSKGAQWAKYVAEKSSGTVKATCAKCGAPIEAPLRNRTVTYCLTCKRQKWAENSRRWRNKQNQRD